MGGSFELGEILLGLRLVEALTLKLLDIKDDNSGLKYCPGPGKWSTDRSDFGNLLSFENTTKLSVSMVDAPKQ